MQKVADKLNSIERAVEKEMQKPAPKKRRRIWSVCEQTL